MKAFIRNSAFHFLGGLVPAIASLLTVPVIVARLGEVHYGLFALVTAIVGYFAILDINVTAGSVKFISEFNARREHRKVSQVVALGGLIYGAIGLAGGLAIAGFAPELVTSVFNVPATLRATAETALYVAAIGFFLGQVQVYLQSVPQALQRYDVSGKLESVFGTLVPCSTLIAVLAGGDLVDIMIARSVLSALNILVLLRLLRRLLPSFAFEAPGRDIARAVTSFSAYAFLSRFASTTYVNADKLLIGALADLRSLSFYTVPFMLANRVFGLIFRVGQVLFPMSSALAASGDTAALRRTYFDVTRYVVYLNACVALMLAVFARELLHYWAGDVFGVQAAQVLIIIVTAVFVDSLTNIPSLVNDGLGRPKNTGVFAVIRALVGVGAAWVAIRVAGILGAAWAQLAVSSLMAGSFVVFIHKRALPASLCEVWLESWRPTILPMLPLVVLSGASIHRDVMSLPVFLAAGCMFAFLLAVYGLLIVCRPAHRDKLLGVARRRLGWNSPGP